MEDKSFLSKPGAAGSIPAHNDTTSKQGGASGEYYHITSAINSALTDEHAQLSALHTDGNPEFLAVKLTTGAGANKVLTSDADGNATWETATAGGGIDFLTAQVFS